TTAPGGHCRPGALFVPSRRGSARPLPLLWRGRRALDRPERGIHAALRRGLPDLLPALERRRRGRRGRRARDPRASGRLAPSGRSEDPAGSLLTLTLLRQDVGLDA